MGVHLAKPSTTVFVDSGVGPGLRFAAGEMQVDLE